MKNLSRKYQFKLTIAFSLIFMVLAVIIYFHFTSMFKEKEIEKIKVKANIFISYFENNKEAFSGERIANEELLTTLIDYNKVNYIVLKNNYGRLIRIFISGERAKNYFTTVKYTEGIDLDKRSEEHTSELQSHSFISYAVFCLKKKNKKNKTKNKKKKKTK